MDELLNAIHDADAEMRWLGFHLLDDWLARSETDMSSSAQQTLLEKLGEPAKLCERVRNDVPHVRAEAGLFLLRLDGKSAFAMLMPLLERSKGVEEGQLERLIERLGATGCRESIPWLKRHARRGWFEGRFGWVALVALAQLDDSTAKGAIVDELRSASPKSRSRAFDAVRLLRLGEAREVLEAMAVSGKSAQIAAEAREILLVLRPQS
jgi:hypothetical protein